MAPSVIDILVRAKNQASRELDQVTKQLKGLDKATKIAVGGLSALAGGYALQQAGRFAMEMAQLNTQLERSAFAFEHFSGGTAQAEANLRAVQRASGGLLTTFEAQNLAVTAMTQGLASTSFELERVTKVARGIVAVSPVINDMETAFSQLALTIANQSTMRLDQLGTSAGELKPKIEELKAANKGMSDEMAFQIALMDTLESKYEPLMQAAVNSASGVERLTAALKEQRATIATYFGWLDVLAGDYADIITTAQKQWEALELITNPPSNMTAQQSNILGQMAAVLDAGNKGQMNGQEVQLRLVQLLETYKALGDAAVQAGQAEASAAKAAAAEQDKQLATMRSVLSEIETGIQAGAQRVFQQVFAATGDADQAARAYEEALRAIRFQLGALQNEKGFNPDQLLMALPVVVNRLSDAVGAMYETQDASDKAEDAAQRLGSAMSKLDVFVGGAASSLMVFARNAGAAQAASVNLMGAISAAYSAMEKVSEGPIGLGDRQKDRIGNLLPSKELKQVNSELNAIVGGVGRADSAFSDLKSTISGIVSGAIGPVAGVDANDLLPRPDAINENARRLADIAVNGIKGQSWLEEFKNEVPGVWEEIANSDDPKQAAAKILKDFQDGLRPELLDKQTAKDLVKRALQGDANTKQLVDEIAGELASELGISLSDAKAKASEVLGGDTGGGVTGVSLAPTIDASAAASAASTFASAFTSAIEGGSLGADLSGAIYTQITASVAMIETTGKEAGNTFVKGFTTTFDNIPAAFIAAIAGLVTPIVQANITNNGGRTGAATT